MIFQSAHRLPTTLVAASVALSTAALVLMAMRKDATRGGSRRVTESFRSGRASDGERLVVVHAKWCGHCTELLRPGGVWEKVRRALPGVRVEAVDEAKSPATVRRLGVTSFPSIHVVDADGRSVAEYEDVRNADAIVDFVMRHIPPA